MLMQCDQNDISLPNSNLCRLASEKHVQSEWHDESLVCVWQVFYFLKFSTSAYSFTLFQNLVEKRTCWSMERKQIFEIFCSTLLKSSIFIYTIIVLLSIIIYTIYYINILIKLLFILYIFGTNQ